MSSPRSRSDGSYRVDVQAIEQVSTEAALFDLFFEVLLEAAITRTSVLITSLPRRA